jgi:hypothetical protein
MAAAPAPNSFAAHLRDPGLQPGPIFNAPTYEPTLPFPAYDFPRFNIISERLRRQYETPGGVRPSERVMSMPLEDFAFFKNLVSVIESSRPGRASGEGRPTNRGFIKINYEILLLLITRLQKFPSKVQLEEFYKVVSVIEDFGNIEHCLITQYPTTPASRRGVSANPNRETLYNLLYALDKTFENWIYNLLDHTKSVGTTQWNKYFTEYREQLKTELLQFTNTTNAEHVNICFTVQPSIVANVIASQSQLALGRRTQDFYMTIRNNFILLCDYVGLSVPIDTHIFFQYVENCAAYICEYSKTIESLVDLAKALGESDLEAFSTFTHAQKIVFFQLLRTYCALKQSQSVRTIADAAAASVRAKNEALNKAEFNKTVQAVAERIVKNKERITKSTEETKQFKSAFFNSLNSLTKGHLSTITEKSHSTSPKQSPSQGGTIDTFSQARKPTTREQHAAQTDAAKMIINNAKDNALYTTLALAVFIYAASLKRNPLTLIRKTVEARYLHEAPRVTKLKKDGTPRKPRAPEQHTMEEIIDSFTDLSKWKLLYNISVVAPRYIANHGLKILPVAATVGWMQAKSMEQFLEIKQEMQRGLDEITGYKKQRELEEAKRGDEDAREAQEERTAEIAAQENEKTKASPTLASAKSRSSPK